MAAGNNNLTTVQWSASSTKSLTSNTAREFSDAVAINTAAIAASIQIKVDNASTPASGDTVNLWVSWSPDGTNYDTEEHAQYLDKLDTYATNDPGEDPAARTYNLNILGKQSFKLISRANQGASRNITISAIYNEYRV